MERMARELAKLPLNMPELSDEAVNWKPDYHTSTNTGDFKTDAADHGTAPTFWHPIYTYVSNASCTARKHKNERHLASLTSQQGKLIKPRQIQVTQVNGTVSTENRLYQVLVRFRDSHLSFSPQTYTKRLSTPTSCFNKASSSTPEI